MSQIKDYADQTDPNYRPQYRGYHGGYARADAGDRTGVLAWKIAAIFGGIGATVIGGIIIAQLKFFGSEVVEQGKAIARIEANTAAMQDVIRQQGDIYAEFRREITDRISRIERGEVSRRAR